MSISARFFLCLRCRQQVMLCRRCDRGQIYCEPHCSKASRRERQREARHRYANSRAGRHNNAERQRPFRQRQRDRDKPITKIVTVQGSTATASIDTIAHKHVELNAIAAGCCHRCGQVCSSLLRRDFLKPDQPHRRQRNTHKDTDP